MRVLIFFILILFASCKTALVPSSLNYEISKYNLEHSDTLVDIGCGSGQHDRIIAHYYPNLFLVLEDLPFDLKNNDIKKQIIKSLKNSPFIPNIEGKYRFVSGSEDSIPLQTGKYKNVLCRISLHEFNNRNKMISELIRILSPDGILLIVEAAPSYEGQVDKYCKRPYLSKDEIISLLKPLKLTEETFASYEDGTKGNILKFRK